MPVALGYMVRRATLSTKDTLALIIVATDMRWEHLHDFMTARSTHTRVAKSV